MKESQFTDILEEFSIVPEFPKAVLKEASSIPSEVLPSDLKGRKDLRDLPFVTIDGETAKDFDDAVYVKREAAGFRLWVSIADVSHYIPIGSQLDQEAYRRATSLYLPGECIPMLPEKLSNGICSLNPHVDRLSFTAEMVFNQKGILQKASFYKSVFRSTARLTYTLVKQILVDKTPAIRKQWSSHVPILEAMEVLADQLTRMRVERGTIDFDLPEPEIVQSLEEGKIEAIVRSERNKAHRIIEEFMIAANEAVASYLSQDKRPSLYRIHEQPSIEKLKDFQEFVHNLGYSFKLGKSVPPKAIASFIKTVRGRDDERLINMILLRSMAQAVYSMKNCGHYGLASQNYTHFTSPIRRYPDLLIHRLLQAKLLGPKPVYTAGYLDAAAKHCSETERAIMKVEYAARDLMACTFMQDHIKEQFEGTIIGVTRFGFFVELDTFFVEGLVSARSLKDDYYIYREKNHMMVGRRSKKKFRLGGRVTIEVVSVNLTKRWIDFKVVTSD